MDTNATAASTPAPPQPGVIMWYKSFIFAQAILTLAGSVTGLSLIPKVAEDPDPEVQFLATILMAALLFWYMGVFVTAFLLPLFLRPRPWLWTYGIVLMGLGMMTCWFIPACVPLMVHWFRPATKAYFGKK
jgi:hypothetical protein